MTSVQGRNGAEAWIWVSRLSTCWTVAGTSTRCRLLPTNALNNRIRSGGIRMFVSEETVFHNPETAESLPVCLPPDRKLLGQRMKEPETNHANTANAKIRDKALGPPLVAG